MLKSRVTRERLFELLDCDPVAGLFRWKVWRPNGVKVGDIAGSEKGDGYLRICIDSKRYGIHNLVWFAVHNTWPSRLDHKDRNKKNNSISNLRVATREQNIYNCSTYSSNSLGLKGVHEKKGKYVASIRVNKRLISLGRFRNPEEAHVAYCEAARKYAGEFFCDGS